MAVAKYGSGIYGRDVYGFGNDGWPATPGITCEQAPLPLATR